VRRMTHTSHHRGQLMAMLRMLGRDVHSNYGPTADTGGLMVNHAPTIYAYGSLEELLAGRVEEELRLSYQEMVERRLQNGRGRPFEA
jgi:hypothetical protein